MIDNEFVDALVRTPYTFPRQFTLPCDNVIGQRQTAFAHVPKQHLHAIALAPGIIAQVNHQIGNFFCAKRFK